jgi:hypothetical protein
VLLLKLEAQKEKGKTYQSKNFWVPNYLSSASLFDPGLALRKKGDVSWSVTATRGVATYV